MAEASQRMALGRQHAAARIGGRGDGAALGPGLEIVDGIDDPAAELLVGRTGAVGAVLFERPRGKAQEFGGFLGAQKARRQKGHVGAHGSAFRGLKGTADDRRTNEDHDGEG
jgi:hypothetical protein